MTESNALRACLAGCAALVLAGCLGAAPAGPDRNQGASAGASGGEVPAWVTSPPSGGGYAYGVGSAEIYADPASALNRAQDRARAELLKRLEVTVSGSTTASRSRTVEDGDSRITRSVMDTVASRVPETELRNIEIARTFAAEGADTAYALARLNRTEAEMDLAGRIEVLDARIREIAGRDPGGGRLQRLKALMPALPLLEERAGVLDKLQLVAVHDPGHRLPEAFRSLQRRIAGLLDSLVVVLRPQGEASRKMDSGLRQALADQGVQVRESGSGDLALRYQAGLRSVRRDGRSFVFADGNVTVLDGGGGVIDEFQARVKAGSVDPGVARDRAVGRLAEGLGSKLGERLLDSFEQAAGRQ
ncbi:MAG TPA: LPP20 family lipoprotein [Gammaproteobacteria bacterium]|nr:LPP20 family lipoprotein [Gammaproteobacteria bacterium]